MIQEAIFTRASAFAALTAFIGSGTSARCHHRVMPQQPTYPSIRYFMVGAGRDSTMGADSGIVKSRFQFDVFALTADNARDVGDALRRCLQRFRGTNLGGTGLQVFDTFIDNEQDAGEPELLDGVKVFRKIYDVLIDYTE